jgi:hypothetical protein
MLFMVVVVTVQNSDLQPVVRVPLGKAKTS